MLNILYKYLLLNNHVGIPGIGNFTVEETPAQFKGSSILPPAQSILFQPGSALTDKNFYHFLAIEKNISEVDAVRKFQDFAYDLKKNIQANPFVEITGLGMLKRNNAGEIYFEPASSPAKYFPVLNTADNLLSIPRASTAEERRELSPGDEIPVKKDRWWIWAAILALLAITSIGYYYMQQNGF